MRLFPLRAPAPRPRGSGPVLLALPFALACNAAVSPTREAPPRTADDLAARYVSLALALGERDPLFLDHVFSRLEPPEPPDPPPPLPEIAERAGRLEAAAGEIARTGEEFRVRRIAASVRALGFRARSLLGEPLPVARELREIFGLDFGLEGGLDGTEPAADLERLHFRVDRALPGVGPLRVRVRRHYERSAVPPETVGALLVEELAACRGRTLPDPAPFGIEPLRLARIPRPEASRRPTGPAPFYRYRGGGRGVLELPAGLSLRPAELGRLACHEGVPGHHLQATVAEAQFHAAGWPELGIVPLYGPRTAVFEGLAATFERLAPAPAADEALRALEPVVSRVLAGYLDGGLSRVEAVRALDFEALVPDPHGLVAHADRFGGYALVRPSADPVFRAALETLLDPALDREDRFRATVRAIREAMSPRELAAVFAR